MSSLTKKLVLSVLTLIITVGAFSATTFAWFTLGNVATTGPATGEMQAAGGLEMSLGATNVYQSAYTSEQMNTYIENIAANLALTAVTRNADSVFSKFGTETAPVKNAEYLQFDVHFRSSTAGFVYLTDASINSSGRTFILGHNYVQQLETVESVTRPVVLTTLLANSSHKFFSTDAARLSVVGAAGSYIGESAAAANANQTSQYLGNTLGAGKEIRGAHDYYQKTTATSDIQAATLPTILGTTHIISNNHSATESAVKNKEGVVADLKLVELTRVEAEEGQPASQEYFKGTITITLWIEGWDYEAFNAILNDNLTFALAFEKKQS